MDVIKIENVSKQYRLGVVGTNTLRGDVARWWAKICGKEDPALKIGADDNYSNVSGDYLWALKNVDLKVSNGDILGIIGKNGAGKTTLLKLLTRITAPSKGLIKIKGKIASLLEVGTGFHPELTGRENIFLNGAILGMTKKEIRDKFDEIVDFSGVEQFIDTPVKRYSSGMYVRLAFAVAAHLEPDILVVDEVLAVGDAEFQRRCVGKMQDVSSNEGRTVLFVSHNMASIKYLCERVILLDNGKIIMDGDAQEVVNNYVLESRNESSGENKDYYIDTNKLKINKNLGIQIDEVKIINPDENNSCLYTGCTLKFIIKYSASKQFIAPRFIIRIKDELDIEVIRLSNMPISGYVINELFNHGVVELIINKLPLVKGKYYIDLAFSREKAESYLNYNSLIYINVQGNDVYNSGVELDRTRGIVCVEHQWSHNKM